MREIQKERETHTHRCRESREEREKREIQREKERRETDIYERDA